jgi:hypothetical protein
MREQVLRGDNARCMGMTVVLRQGLWAWMMLVAAEDADAVAARGPVRSAPGPPALPARVCGELLAAWTDLVVGTVGRLEVS